MRSEGDSRPSGRRESALAVAISCASAACGGAPEPAPPQPAPVPAVASSAPLPAGLPDVAPGRSPLGTTRATPLPIALHAIQGADAVLAVHDHAGSSVAYAQRVGADGDLGPVLTLSGAHVAGVFALDRGGETTVATSEAGKLCMTTFRGAESATRGCSEVRAHALAAVDGRVLAISSDPPIPDEAEAPKPKPKPKPAPKKGKGRGKKKKEPSAVDKLFSSGRELEIAGRWVLADGSVPADPTPSGLRFTEPMIGMNLVGAWPRGERIDIAFYERAAPRGKEKRGAIGVAALDAAGTFVEGSRKSFGDSKLQAGFLTDHVDPRLSGFGEGSILLAHRGARGKCDVTVVAPFVMQMIPESTDCALEPRRFFRLAQSKRKGTAVDLPALPEGVSPESARRVSDQAAWDVGRTVLTTTRAFALVDDKIVSWPEGGPVNAGKRALLADQLRIHASAVASDGSALAFTSAGLVMVDASGASTPIPAVEPRFSSNGDREDVAAVERRLGVKVGSTWYQAEGELRRLAPQPGPTIRELHPDAGGLAGGSSTGMLVDLVGSTLVLHALSEKGELTELGRMASPVRAGFDVVERRAGGAIVVGKERGAKNGFVTFAIDGAGKLVATHRPVFPVDQPQRPRLSALPASGGALLWDAERRAVVWLDDDAAPLVASAWPTEAAEAVCWDGTPARRSMPGPDPDVWVPMDARPGTCVSAFGWSGSGTLRWLGSTAATIHTRAETGSIRAPTNEKLRATTPARTEAPRPAAAPSHARCPGEMVLVSGDLCVDRYESTLADRARGRYTSPDYPPTPSALTGTFGDYVTRRERQGDVFARALPVPLVPSWQLGSSTSLVAVSREGIRPSGYVTGITAREACTAAGKRLCKLDEWRRACRGETNQLFPYGASYEDRACNVNSPAHPAAELHQNAAIGHLDPRLNRVEVAGVPLLRVTGGTPRCASRWGDDAIYDMVGNIDEWVDERGGAFAGGFYSRGTTNGCEALVSSHPEPYSDYSTGARCCKDAAP